MSPVWSRGAGCPTGREWSLPPQGIPGDLRPPKGNGGEEATGVLGNVKMSKVSSLLPSCSDGVPPLGFHHFL